MNKKILSFIVKDGKFLVLYSESHPEHGDGGWFVVTGGVEKNETYEDAVVREIKEETNLDVKEIFNLNWGSIYDWLGELCKEMNFVSFVKSGKIILNEEHSKFDWLDLDEFVERIKWDDDKDLLKLVLSKALNKDKYFKNIKFKDYRKNASKKI